MKITAIIGSYRKKGVIDQAVEEMLAAANEGGAETEKIYLADRHIEFCTNCRNCTQEPGTARGRCVHDDDMEGILQLIESSQGIILASPMNFGQTTALTKRFIERLIPFGYWPWGVPVPKLRTKVKTRKAVLITSSAMPAIMARALTGIMRSLKQAADVIGASIEARLFIGMAGQAPDQPLSDKMKMKARRIGLKLARRAA